MLTRPTSGNHTAADGGSKRRFSFSIGRLHRRGKSREISVSQEMSGTESMNGRSRNSLAAAGDTGGGPTCDNSAHRGSGSKTSLKPKVVRDAIFGVTNGEYRPSKVLLSHFVFLWLFWRLSEEVNMCEY